MLRKGFKSHLAATSAEVRSTVSFVGASCDVGWDDTEGLLERSSNPKEADESSTGFRGRRSSDDEDASGCPPSFAGTDAIGRFESPSTMTSKR